MRQWRLLTKDQKIRKLHEEEARKSSKPGKEERLETVRKLKKIWKKREEEVEHKEEPEKEATPEEEEAIVKELEDQELIESGEGPQVGCQTGGEISKPGELIFDPKCSGLDHLSFSLILT